MLRLSLLEIAQIVSAELFGNSEVAISGNVETDSRKIIQGSLFVAKPGEVTDGHLFVDDAIANGAVAVLVERRVHQDIPQLVVADVVQALGLLAKYVVAE
ncbi:MAG: Mur ligase domain-containing protein, partial [Actinomycetes bacterium]